MQTRWRSILEPALLAALLGTVLWSIGYFLVFLIELGGLGATRWVELPIMVVIGVCTGGVPLFILCLLTGPYYQRALDRGGLVGTLSALAIGAAPGVLIGLFMQRETVWGVLVCTAVFAVSFLFFVKRLRAP